MNWLLVATAAQIIIGSSAVIDKALLRRRSIEPWSYAFWFGMLGLFAVLLLPFGYQPTAPSIVLLAIFSGVLFLGASFLTFFALEYLEASETLPLIGALSPVFTLAFSRFWLGTNLGLLDGLGFSFLVASGFLLFLAEAKPALRRRLLLVIAASVLIAGSYVTSKLVFNETSFITGFFWMKMGGVAAALGFLAAPAVRRRIQAASSRAKTSQRVFYFANRGYAAVGSLLTSFAIFLAEPALVDATQNLRYLVVFLLAWVLLRERFRGRALWLKLTAAAAIVIGLLWLALGQYARSLPPVSPDRPIVWGITFSSKFSRELGLDPATTFDAILAELKPEKIRLVAYWSDLEPEPRRYDFSDLDWQLDKARLAGAEVTLVAGLKVPRWPECHVPEWAQGLETEERELTLRTYLSELIPRYRDRSEIVMWQVENEPYLPFGKCHDRGKNFLEQEIALVKSLVSIRPVLTTDGGEFGLWAKAARHGDVFGTTMYRKVYPRFIGPLFGVVEYPIAPSYFRVKERVVKWWNKTPNQRFIVSELQGEPWFPTSLAATPYETQVAEFSPAYFRDTITYAKAAGFDEYYLWGAEWWYYMKEKHGDNRYWDLTKIVFAPR